MRDCAVERRCATAMLAVQDPGVQRTRQHGSQSRGTQGLMMLTLWDILKPKPKPRTVQKSPGGRDARPTVRVASKAKAPTSRAAAEYLRVEREMLARYGVRVRKWRSHTSGVAWEITYRDGSISRLIESPRPRGPVSAAIFLHEIGHHAIGFRRYKPRCLEEYHAWRFALDEMERQGLNITPRVRKRVRDALQYAIAKAQRRGLRTVPPEVAACIAEQDRLLAQPVSASKSASIKASGSNG